MLGVCFLLEKQPMIISLAGRQCLIGLLCLWLTAIEVQRKIFASALVGKGKERKSQQVLKSMSFMSVEADLELTACLEVPS
jgi:hypothetical protein